MSAEAALAALAADGAELLLRDGRLHAKPPGRISPRTAALVRSHAEELRARLARPIDLTDGCAHLLAIGRWVTCECCERFKARPAHRPDGSCTVHGETWARVPFHCETFIPAAPDLNSRGSHRPEGHAA